MRAQIVAFALSVGLALSACQDDSASSSASDTTAKARGEDKPTVAARPAASVDEYLSTLCDLMTNTPAGDGHEELQRIDLEPGDEDFPGGSSLNAGLQRMARCLNGTGGTIDVTVFWFSTPEQAAVPPVFITDPAHAPVSGIGDAAYQLDDVSRIDNEPITSIWMNYGAYRSNVIIKSDSASSDAQELSRYLVDSAPE